MKAKSFRFPHFPVVLIALYALFSLTSCGVIGANNNYSVSFTPSGVAFGNVSVGTVASQTATVSNPGSNPVTIAAARITGSDFSIKGLEVPLTLNPGASAPFTVTFSPKAAGPATGTVALTSTLSTQASANLGISGTGTSSTPAAAPAQIAVSPATVAFGSISAGATATQYVTVSNSGGSTLTISQLAVSGNSFAETGPVTPFTVAAGQSQILAINFAPPSAGTYSGSLGISSDAGNTVGPVALSGSATAPVTLTLSASPTSLSFGSVVVGNNATQNLLLSNTGNSAVTVSSGTASGAGFSIIAPAFPVVIAAGQSQQVSIRFAPSSSGNAAGSATFASNATNSPTVVSLSGTGTAPVTPAQIAVSPGTISFGSVLVGSSGTQSLTVSNPGGSTLTVSQITLTGSGFTESGPATPFTIAAGQSQVLSIGFAPTTAGSYTGSLAIVSNASNSVSPVAISGTGATVPVLTLSISPSSLSFGSVTVGNSSSLTATLTNTGNSTVTVFSGSATGAGFSIASPAFPVTINAGATRQVSISFAPQASGAVTGSASFVSNASNSPTTASLTGTGAVAVQHTVALSWNASTSVVSGYRIYRGTQSGGPYSVLNTTLNAGLTYTDSSVQSGQTYYYVVTAVDSSGNESVYSNQATAVIP